MIDYHLSKEADELFDGEIELDESYFGGIRKGKQGRSAGGKTAVLVFSNGKVKFIPLSLMTPKQTR